MDTHRKLPFGAEVGNAGGVHFRVWAPERSTCEVLVEGGPIVALAPGPGGTFAGLVEQAGDGTRYRYRLDGGLPVPDPVSRFQPEGPHGPSRVVDPTRFPWSDAGWAGLPRGGQVLYELHLGTFTSEGTYAAAARELPELVALGVTAIELMPLADFPGRFGWGYDGVNLYAPTRLYGEPDDLRRLVDRAHALGLGVILDVVYNHLGPDGNYLGQLTPAYFSTRHRSEWGGCFNFDEPPGAARVRDYVAGNAAYWIDEYHFDGLRLDATQAIIDDSEDHILAEIGRRARAAAPGRATFLAAENDDQIARLARPAEAGGYGLDAVWNDDFQHSARVAATGRREGYYTDFLGTPQELLSAVKWGYLYQGQRYSYLATRRGTPALDLSPEQRIFYLENHDQIAHSGRGLRLRELTSPGRLRALTALLLLAPGTPLLFQGQELGTRTPFLYFADHGGQLGADVRRGRAQFLAQFASLATPEAQAALHDPAAPEAFARCKLDRRVRDEALLALHRDLLALRRGDQALRAGRGVDGAVLGPEAFCLRWLAGEPRLLVVNLGVDLHLRHAPEPLLAPPEGRRWRTLWSSEDVRYGGSGTPELDDDELGWSLPGQAAVLLAG